MTRGFRPAGPLTCAALAAACLCPWAVPSAAAQTVVIAAAGDIACDPGDPSYNGGTGTATNCHMKATSDLLLAGGYTAVLVLGDNQYEDGALARYQASFEPS